MKKLFPILSTLLLLILALNTGSVNASISELKWVAPTDRGGDDFYGVSIIGYQSGSTGTLIVYVWNHIVTVMNVSAVKLWFDWNENFTSTDVSESNVHQIDPGSTHAFIVNFSA